uniref:Zygote arrest 1-like n=1 Tax=Jaculus jaculus TaxID=51337 RepID=A0A8C5LEJ8_JACJA
MERFVRLPCHLYQGHGNTLPLGSPAFSGPCKQPDWRQTAAPPTFLASPGLLVPANISDYCMYPYKRAQLKAILTQMNPNLSVRMCKADTKEVGIQVSLKVDKSVQCSLGPRTLSSSPPWNRTGHREPLLAWGVYSPAGRRALIRSPKDGEEQGKESPDPAKATQQLPPTSRSDDDKQEEEEPVQPQELREEGAVPAQERKGKQFLEPKYGYFHCKDCKTRWESAYVWCISGTNKVYFKQLCCKCQKSFNPYRVEAIQCQTCSKTRCSCPQKKRHIDLMKPHRQELCGRCKDKKFPCGNIHRLKY